MFDSFYENKISFVAFQKGCSKIGLSVEKKDIYLLMKRFDKDNDSFLSYNEFYEMIMPTDIANSDLLNKKSIMNTRRELNSYTKKCISSILQLLMERELHDIEEKVKMISDHSWDYEVFFKEIADENVDYFIEENLTKYLWIDNNYQNENNIGILFRHYDKDGDMKVTFDEFVEELSN